MNVLINRTWMTHSSGTKFYQIFEMKPRRDGRAITLVHFGKLTGRAEESFPRPVNGGQSKISLGPTGFSKMGAKKQRGYEVQDTMSTDESSASSWWREAFGAKLAQEIEVAMFGGSMGAGPDPSEEPDNEVIAEKKAPLITERPANWGVW